MWLKNVPSSVAPFAGLMLVGYEKQRPLERSGEEIDEVVEDVRAGGETAGNQIDDVRT